MSYFVYRSLTPHIKRIRLVRVFAEDHDASDTLEFGSTTAEPPSTTLQTESTICCEIYHVSLNGAPPYCALSYNWGDPTKTSRIIANGAVLSITANLEVALRHLRMLDQPVVLWIDALCIDQDDEAEKTEQLEQMREIYSQASSVVAWLGPAGDDSDIAMRWIQTYGSKACGLGIGSTYSLQLRSLLRARASRDHDRTHDMDDALGSFIDDLTQELLSPSTVRQRTVVRALNNLLKRPYWGRIWVVQEMVSALTIEFVCGKERVTEDAFHHGLRLLRNARQHLILTTSLDKAAAAAPPDSSLFHIETQNPVLLLKFRRSRGPFPLLYLLRSLRRFKATDPRDKVFALYGISLDAVELGLRPDYRKSCAEVYTNVAEVLLRRGNFELFSLCSPSANISDLPTWAPDWSIFNNRTPLQQRSLVRKARPLTTNLEPRFAASPLHKEKILVSTVDSDVRTVRLLSQATILGIVEDLGTAWNNGGISSWFQDLYNFSQLCKEPFKAAEEKYNLVWRTAVADQQIRQGNTKPRLSDSVIASVHEALEDKDPGSLTAQILVDAGLRDYNYELHVFAPGRRPVIMSSGHVAVVPEETIIGDELAIFAGAQTPHILRRCGEKNEFQVVGETYVHGIMDGEGIKPSSVFETVIIV